jgi:hypothetical protein
MQLIVCVSLCNGHTVFPHSCLTLFLFYVTQVSIIHFHSEINPLKTKRICFIQGLSVYRAVNTLHFGYKNQSLNVL